MNINLKNYFVALIFIPQVIFFSLYMLLNVVSVGTNGVAIGILLSFFLISGVVTVGISLIYSIRVKYWLYNFLGLLVWLSWRVVNDIGSIEYLKSITIATTGGMLLFLLIGLLLGVNIKFFFLWRPLSNNKSVVCAGLFSGMFMASVWAAFSLSTRLRADVFFLNEIEGYQRAGNFLSIFFLVCSFLLIHRVNNAIIVKRKVAKLEMYFWQLAYVLMAVLLMLTSQMFASNSATAVIFIIYSITAVMIFIGNQVNRKFIYVLSLPQMLIIFKTSIKTLFVFSLIVFSLISYFDFELNNLRVFGFGEGTNTSLSSRFDILHNSFSEQVGYSPILGNINVAYLTSGDEGKFLHNFLPYIWANLGLLGLFFVLSLFYLVFRGLYIESRTPNSNGAFIACYSFYIILALFLFANLTTSISWLVIWFALGLMAMPIKFLSTCNNTVGRKNVEAM